jgi:arylsulfatase A-like enzyme
VELVDIVPSLLELLGLHRSELEFHGRSFVPLLRGESGLARATYSGGLRGRGVLHMGRWKYHHHYGLSLEELAIRNETGREASPALAELYDLDGDSGERRNVAARNPDVVADLRRKLEAIELNFSTDAQGEQIPVDAETAEQLRALGYID